MDRRHARGLCVGDAKRDSANQRRSRAGRRASVARRADRRRDRPGPPRAGTFRRARDRTHPDLRRPGRDRDRERAAVRRGAGAHPRPHRGVATADRDRGRAEGHQPFGVRSANGVRHVAGLRRRTVRRRWRRLVHSGRRRVPLQVLQQQVSRPGSLSQRTSGESRPGKSHGSGRGLRAGRMDRGRARGFPIEYAPQ